jgi:hypothetical protein
MRKRFYFDTFEHLSSFDILKGEEVIDLYLKNHLLLGKEGHEKQGGDNAEPLFDTKHNIDPTAFWNGYSPAYYEIESFKNYSDKGRKGITYSADAFAKADVVSMDLSGLNDTWTHFIYLELPNKLFVDYQDKVHSNPDINIFKKFVNSVLEKDLNKEEIIGLAEIYDKRHPEFITFDNYFGKDEQIAWRADIELTQLVSIKETGLIYPILYPQTHGIFKRGTHRAIIHALLGFDVPIFMQVPIDIESRNEWKVEMADMFSLPNVTFTVDIENKKLQYYTDNTEIHFNE